ncbi:hypothetical protein COT87_00840 [Candidatus Collierbacteria bacterium CG10_big_fil_rev_8_21_14_0_10_44_9]|uniref:Uncharacterized protein n=1 Tax=Candidatus Collierbacteria bacterium CG10_big_fil_rev_8_21_14_0_10_44_9 TaxID=1974535 RepID=A0A2H0VJ98_9BACT|nr:MAG: hypothetical protein COT87_00840 [Candidatus Collierbacteria bacterium CG10_big_fil_rev_8_21_14_0_10_44_9]
MKSFIACLVTTITLGIVGFYAFKDTINWMSKLNPTPFPFPTVSPLPSPSPTLKPTLSPSPSYPPTTKGGIVQGVSAIKKTTTTTTTTTSHLLLTLVKTSVCPISYMTEIKDIAGPLTFKYKLIDNTSFNITVWNKDGNELVQNTTYSGNAGQIKTISDVNYLKVRLESKTCASNNDNWLTLTAQR